MVARIRCPSGPQTASAWCFNSRRAGGANLYRQPADGTGVAEPLTEGQSTFVPTSITSDGGVLLGHSSIPRAWTLFVLPLGKRAPPEPLLQSLDSHTYPGRIAERALHRLPVPESSPGSAGDLRPPVPQRERRAIASVLRRRQ